MTSGTQRTRQRQTAAQKARADAADASAAERLAARLEQESQGRPVPVLDETPYPEPDVTADDPLADLRQDDDPSQPSEASEPAAETFSPGALVTEDQQTLARHTLVAAWHADPTTMGFLHRGEVCGCWYITGVTVGAILPVQANDDGTGEGGTE